MSVTRHLIVVVLSALLPLFIVAVVLAVVLVRGERQATEKALQESAQRLAQALDAEVARSFAALEGLARGDTLRRGDLKTFYREATELRDSLGLWDNILLLSPRAEHLLNLRRPYGETLPPVPQPEGTLTAAATRKPYVSNALKGRVETEWLMYIAYPVIHQGEVRYVIGATMNYRYWTRWLAENAPSGRTAGLIDSNGVILARTQEPERAVGQAVQPWYRDLIAASPSGLSRGQGMTDSDVVVAFHRAALSGWTVNVLTSGTAMDAPMRRTAVFVSLAVLAALLIALGLASRRARVIEQGHRASESLLRRSEERFRGIAHAAPAIVWVADEAGMVFINQRWEELTGQPADRAAGRGWAEFVHPEDQARLMPQRERSRATGEPYEGQIRYRGRDGGYRWHAFRALRASAADGAAAQWFGCAVDIHEAREAQQALKEAEARFRALMDQAPFSMQIFAPDGRTRRVNAAWSLLWGLTQEQIADYNVLADPQLEKKGLLPYLRRAFEGEVVEVPAIRYDPNETIPNRTRNVDPARYVSAVAYPLKDDHGRVNEVVLVHEDITGRRRAEGALRESEEKLRLLADTIPQLAWMARPDGDIFWYNRRWYDYTGTTPQEMEGSGWQKMHDPVVLPEVLERWKDSIASGKPFEMVFPLRSAAGTFRQFLTRVNPLRDAEGRVLYWFGTNTDISEMKRMEEALREADRRKDDFLATLAHELRNPLAPIVNSLQILKMPAVDAGLAQRTRDMMERQVNHLVRLVDDLLDMSRVVRGKVELRKEVVDLASIVARAVETAQPFIDAKGHRLDVAFIGEPLNVNGDPVRLVQVVGNLLTNAARYTQRHGRIVISARASGHEAVLSVEDNGIGIAAEMLAHVFEPFVQGEQAAARAEGGLGIGLTLVKSLVELHGGEVQIHSDGRGKGTRVTIRLPTSAATASRTPATRPAVMGTTPRTGQRILVVDDNKDAAESLGALLRLQAYDVRIAYNGSSAIEAAQGRPPKFVFLDIGMPRMDGYETARRLRALPGMQSATIVALTGWGQEEDRRRSAAAGFDHHLVKPPNLEALAEILSNEDSPAG